MVGVFVDWFVVVVLFCCVLILFVLCYIEIILKNKDKIVDNFVVFVCEKFFGFDVFVVQICQYDFVQKFGVWFGELVNIDVFGGYVMKLMSFVFDMIDDVWIQLFVYDVFCVVIDWVDLL